MASVLPDNVRITLKNLTRTFMVRFRFVDKTVGTLMISFAEQSMSFQNTPFDSFIP